MEKNKERKQFQREEEKMKRKKRRQKKLNMKQKQSYRILTNERKTRVKRRKVWWGKNISVRGKCMVEQKENKKNTS